MIAEPISIQDLLQQEQVDMGHARCVTRLALQLFDATVQVHQLGDRERALLDKAALLHNVGMMRDQNRHHRAGHDLILEHELEGVSEQDRNILAMLTLFHRKKVKPDKEPLFEQLDENSKREVLKLAAILRVTDGLDYSQTQTTTIQSVGFQNNQVVVVVDGPHADEDAARANRKADLWQEIMPVPLFAQSAAEEARMVLTPGYGESDSALSPEEPITTAGKKIIGKQYKKLRRLAAGFGFGTDAESVHDARGAVRRLTEMLDVLRDCYSGKTVDKILKPAKKLDAHLGSVRDLDVITDKLQTYAAARPVEHQVGLQLLLADWDEQRAAELRTLVDFLQSKRYRTFTDRMETFLDAPEEEGPPVYEELPILVLRLYNTLRRCGPEVDQAPLEKLHKLRMDTKRLRDTLDLFGELLGEPAPQIIQQLTDLKDTLGALKDLDVAQRNVEEFIAGRSERQQNHVDLQGVTDYLGALKENAETSRQKLAAQWAGVMSAEFRDGLARALAAA